MMKPVVLEEIRDSSLRIAMRLDLGEYVVRGPRENQVELESRVAWATVSAQLHREGYIMVFPAEYASRYRMSLESVMTKIEKEGNLFALIYAAHDENHISVPLEEREARELPDENSL